MVVLIAISFLIILVVFLLGISANLNDAEKEKTLLGIPMVLKLGSVEMMLPIWAFRSVIVIVLTLTFLFVSSNFKFFIVSFDVDDPVVNLVKPSDETELITYKLFNNTYLAEVIENTPYILKFKNHSHLVQFEALSIYKINKIKLNGGKDLVDLKTGIDGKFPILVVLPSPQNYQYDCFDNKGKVAEEKCIKVQSPGMSLGLGLELLTKEANQYEVPFEFDVSFEEPHTSGKIGTAKSVVESSLKATQFVAILGGYNSSSSAQIAEIATRKKIPAITPSSSATGVNKKPEIWTFMMTANNDLRADVAFDFVVQELLASGNVGIVFGEETGDDRLPWVKRCMSPDIHYSSNQACLLYKRFDRNSKNHTPLMFPYTIGNVRVADFVDIFDRLEKRNVEVVIFAGLDEEIMQMARARSLYLAKNTNYNPAILVPGPKEVFENKRATIFSLMNGFISLNPGHCEGSYYKWKFDQLYAGFIAEDERNKEKYGMKPYFLESPPDRSARSYDAGSIIVKAITDMARSEAMNEKYGDKVGLELYRFLLREKIQNTRYDGVSGFISFDELGESSMGVNILVVTDNGLRPYSTLMK